MNLRARTELGVASIGYHPQHKENKKIKIKNLRREKNFEFFFFFYQNLTPSLTLPFNIRCRCIKSHQALREELSSPVC
jgi:hypothetical protein